MIEPGDRAPDFELPDQDGRAVKLGDYAGQMLVLYFYPKADTWGLFGSSYSAPLGKGRGRLAP